MNRRKLIAILFVATAFYVVGALSEAAAQDLTGIWTGTANGANGYVFIDHTITLTVTAQNGYLFNGSISFDGGLAFPVSGSIFSHRIRITASESLYDAIWYNSGSAEYIYGVVSKLDIDYPGIETVTYQMKKVVVAGSEP